MKRLLLLFFLFAAFSICALAQDKPKPEAQLLTPAQTQQLIEANKVYTLAQAELELAKERLAKLQADNRTLILTFFIELGLTSKSYEPKLQVIDPKTDKLGFLPVPEPPKEAAKPEPKKQ